MYSVRLLKNGLTKVDIHRSFTLPNNIFMNWFSPLIFSVCTSQSNFLISQAATKAWPSSSLTVSHLDVSTARRVMSFSVVPVEDGSHCKQHSRQCTNVKRCVLTRCSVTGW